MLEVVLTICFVVVVGMWVCDAIYTPYKKSKKDKN